MLQLDNKFLAELQASWVQKLKIFLYEAGCSWKKVWVETEFEVTDDLEISELGTGTLVPVPGIQIYIPKTDIAHLENGRITKTVKADHTWKEKIRYIFTSDEIQDRCWCGTSFAFEKKKPRIDFDKLKNIKAVFSK